MPGGLTEYCLGPCHVVYVPNNVELINQCVLLPEACCGIQVGGSKGIQDTANNVIVHEVSALC